MIPLLNGIVKDTNVQARITTAEQKLQQAQSTLEIDQLAKANNIKLATADSEPKQSKAPNSGAAFIRDELAAVDTDDNQPDSVILSSVSLIYFANTFTS